MAWPVLRPRCWSGKKKTRLPRSKAHSSTFARVGRGADDAAVGAAEGLQAGGGVHVGDGDDVLGGAEELLEFAPGAPHVRLGGHVRHRAAGLHVREDHLLVVGAEDVRSLRHEVHAAEDDVLRLAALRRVLGEGERVAALIGELDDVLALVVVAQDDDVVAERLARRADARLSSSASMFQ
jgi:hypothetical protein